MLMTDRATLRSPLRSPTTFLSVLHGYIRRHRLVRLVVTTLTCTVLVTELFTAVDAADQERSRWGPSALGWITTTEISAGTILLAGDVEQVAVPPGLLPSDAVVDDPTGGRVRDDLGPGELIVSARLAEDVSAHAALIPEGRVAVTLDRTNDLFVVGDRVDLHDHIDGGRLADGALVIAVTEHDLAVAIDSFLVNDVVRSLGRGGVVAVLRRG